MSYPRRDDQGAYYPPNGAYQPQLPQQDISPNLLGMYHAQQNDVRTNQSLVQAHLQQMHYINSQMTSPTMNHHPQPQASQAYYYPTANDYPQQQNQSATYQNQYSYPPPNQYSYPAGPSYSHYPPPPPPVHFSRPTLPETTDTDHRVYREEKHSATVQVQEATPAPVQVKREQEVVEEEKEIKKPVPIMVGKRRGGRVLPTGVVKKQRTENEGQGRSDAWSQYMAEVRRYKEQSCEEERKNRPLVK